MNHADYFPDETPTAVDTTKPAEPAIRLTHSQLTRPLRLAFLVVTVFWGLATAAVGLAVGAGGSAAVASAALAITGFYVAGGLTAVAVRRWELRQVKELLDALNGATQRLADLSVLDELTGVHNRRYFYWQLERELARARRYGTPFTMVLFDIDGLKSINDGLGHLTGDELLRTFARIMQEYSRSTDTCARIGGDEFAVLAPNTPYETAAKLAERLAAAFAATPINLPTAGAAEGPSITSTTS
ncbi:MAG: GGDEF domain-containing protein, partial [Dehalococcoidia bacterium]